MPERRQRADDGVTRSGSPRVDLVDDSLLVDRHLDCLADIEIFQCRKWTSVRPLAAKVKRQAHPEIRFDLLNCNIRNCIQRRQEWAIKAISNIDLTILQRLNHGFLIGVELEYHLIIGRLRSPEVWVA